MSLERRLQALEGSHHDTRAVMLLIRTIEALRSEDPAELAALEVELAGAVDKPGGGCLIAVARALLAASDEP